MATSAMLSPALAAILQSLGAKDSIMETDVLAQLRKFVASGGTPQDAVLQLSDNYRGYAQMANLVATWLTVDGADENEPGATKRGPGDASIEDEPSLSKSQVKVADILAERVAECFDTKKADSIFAEGASAPGWLEELIQSSRWRRMIYSLSDHYKHCLMLNYAIQRISDLGHQMEIASVSTACTYFSVFNRVFLQALDQAWDGDEETLRSAALDLCTVCCHTQHTYLYAQAVLHRIVTSMAYVPNVENVLRLCSEIEAFAMRPSVIGTSQRPPKMVWKMRYAIDEDASSSRDVQTSILYMLHSDRTNPGDISLLHKLYSSPNPPPASFLTHSDVLHLLIRDLFTPGKIVNSPSLQQYTYLLAYAACTRSRKRKSSSLHAEEESSGDTLSDRLSPGQELKATIRALEDAVAVCQRNMYGTQAQAVLEQLTEHVEFPVVCMGVIHWVQAILSDKQYYSTPHHTVSTPLYLDLLRKTVDLHPLLASNVLELLATVFEIDPSDIELDPLQAIQVKRHFINSMLDLLRKGHVMSVMALMTKWIKNVDQSLIRYFVSRLTSFVEPPFSPEFEQALSLLKGCVGD